MEIEKQLIVGLPEAGKTTFLAALWHVVESDEVPESLVVSEVHGVRDHLNKIREDWLNCRQLERTTIPAEKVVSFRLRDVRDEKIVEMSFADLSGETFRLQWESRQWTSEFDHLASQASGVLLFVHPRTVVEPVRIDCSLDALEAVIGESAPGTGVATNVEAWSPAHAPTQVKLVEILQFLRRRSFVDRPLPLVLVVSAWDVVTTGKTPMQWFEQHLPLLAQFLRANIEGIPFEVFGISAQGADLSKANELQQHIKASDRIVVTTPDQSKTHDITAPVKWLLGH